MKTSKTLLLSLFVVGVLCSFTSTQSATTGKDQYVVEWVDVSVNSECADEEILLTGWVKVNVHWVQVNGVYRMQYHYNYNLKGEGVNSGIAYQYKANVNVKSADTDCSGTDVQRLRLRLSSQGSGDDLWVTQFYTYTYNWCEGTYDYNIDETIECR